MLARQYVHVCTCVCACAHRHRILLSSLLKRVVCVCVRVRGHENYFIISSDHPPHTNIMTIGLLYETELNMSTYSLQVVTVFLILITTLTFYTSFEERTKGLSSSLTIINTGRDSKLG